jgi:NADPH-dependent 2,4-dienoyl-CoA reductase/sulfur reductase-like enzyme
VIVIAGAGLSGLMLARELLDKGFQVRVLELRRRVGGISVIDGDARSMLDKLSDIPVELEKAIVRVGGRTLAVSRSGVEEVVRGITATGFRVPSPAELGILGDRPSGVFPFHVALDLATEGLSIGGRIAIYGYNRYSVLLAEKLLEAVLGRST